MIPKAQTPPLSHNCAPPSEFPHFDKRFVFTPLCSLCLSLSYKLQHTRSTRWLINLSVRSWIDMASEETMTINQATIMQEDDEYDDHPHPHHISRLSMCTSNSMRHYDDDDEEDEDGGVMKMYMSRLSIGSFDGDADVEFSDEKEGKQVLGLSSDSDKEHGCYSLPATPSPRRNWGGSVNHQLVGIKEYASENETQKGIRKKLRKNTRRRMIRERWPGRAWDNSNSKTKLDEDDDVVESGGNNCNSFSGESEGGVVVITRPKGGRRSLCMDLDEVKACRDLGFELEHERMMEMPSRISLSGSTLDTSSGGNSPIASWRISSPGDNPRDVKARLKVWAQAVALASTSRHGS